MTGIENRKLGIYGGKELLVSKLSAVEDSISLVSKSVVRSLNKVEEFSEEYELHRSKLAEAEMLSRKRKAGAVLADHLQNEQEHINGDLRRVQSHVSKLKSDWAKCCQELLKALEITEQKLEQINKHSSGFAAVMEGMQAEYEELNVDLGSTIKAIRRGESSAESARNMQNRLHRILKVRQKGRQQAPADNKPPSKAGTKPQDSSKNQDKQSNASPRNANAKKTHSETPDANDEKGTDQQRSEKEKEEFRKEAKSKAFEEQRAFSEAQKEERRAKVCQAWDRYEARWEAIDSLTFSSIPWPLFLSETIVSHESLTASNIADFILSADHSPTKSPKQRVHAALLKWHPDRFNSQVLPKVFEPDRETVIEGVNKVTICLNALLQQPEV